MLDMFKGEQCDLSGEKGVSGRKASVGEPGANSYMERLWLLFLFPSVMGSHLQVLSKGVI